ncbi:putative Mg2+ transporter-C (MgtC) family protein [Chryseobacterium bernardetii]|jgi:putative Mg2+ transporter-C (MgtC) family protein|uniref:Mg2+ transporter-C (MgtC) family protein n=3 Tax=Chryseobacterium TaxID=59732 RepID=A0ACC6J1G2_9FLAO|nr:MULTISPECIES: MgtC/SapB family protein [Chryseobacterium]MDR6372011.1 putative Mg2+ transporter-C (MgtC) family protein [Chryseobacterium vietnamense]MDR6443793.1 putative Mg2+ transporter-C (MgtC) family protein [Chryseobacterium bernardetii]MDR6461466.1 putative Mg2+ transporter-C (MgtC) family protein [Chryseobacterium vietnamense]MDR6488324.1 putative Mg2+ transporter-C (MgtC) family protein [Chryseobacterium vietnamense]TQM18497.1 putative Mg2+ transporter-C (MgtC) family protein [Chry
MDFLQDHYIVKNELLLILISVILGLFIGAEREYRNKSAGLRTFILVCFGACLFTILSIKIGVANPDRLAANIITGIGFLGAGVIFKGDNKIEGITTATTIWATASIGMAVGSGYIYIALLGTTLVLLILSALTYLQNFIDNYNKVREYRIAVTDSQDIKYCENVFKENHLRYQMLKQQYSQESFTIIWRLTGKNSHHEEVIRRLVDDPKIKAYQF